MPDITFTSSGIKEALAAMRRAPDAIGTYTVQAINKTIVGARAESSRDIFAQVAFPSGYLGSPNDTNARLAIIKKATRSDQEAIISARKRATSLGRFLVSRAPGNISVRIKPGTIVPIKGAIVVRLRSGSTLTDDNYNVGVMVRTRQGQALRKSSAAVMLGPNRYLLYGPSVDQVFQTVRSDIVPSTEIAFKTEFFRLLNLRGFSQ